MTDKKQGCGCGKNKPEPEVKHNEYYYEKGRNGWTPDNTDSTLPGNPPVEVTHMTEKDIKVAVASNIQKHDRVSGHVNSKINPKMLLSKEELKEADKNQNFGVNLINVTREITELLIQKNKAYGNTALNPTNIFSKLSSTEAICARIDDKLARISNKGINDQTEDTVNDLIGYLLLLKMSMNEK